MVIKSALLDKIPSLLHGFGTLSEPIPNELRSFWAAASLKHTQVHACSVMRVEQKNQECGAQDALYTECAQLPVGIFTADCVPILLAEMSGKKILAIHAGWRGTRARILQKVWAKLQQEKEQAHQWLAAVGPAIGPCCYEIDEALGLDFEQEFEDIHQEFPITKNSSHGKKFLDLPGLLSEELRAMGFASVDLIRRCTFCTSSPQFCSYRREKAKNRQWSLIMKQ